MRTSRVDFLERHCECLLCEKHGHISPRKGETRWFLTRCERMLCHRCMFAFGCLCSVATALREHYENATLTSTEAYEFYTKHVKEIEMPFLKSEDLDDDSDDIVNLDEVLEEDDDDDDEIEDELEELADDEEVDEVDE